MMPFIEDKAKASKPSAIVPPPLLRLRALGLPQLQKAFWLAVAAGVAVVAFTAEPHNGESALGAALISIAALWPIWLWITGRVRGLPLFPLYASTHIYAFALPLLYEHPIVMLFSPDAQLLGALTVTGFLVLSTSVWLAIGRGATRVPTQCLVLNPASADLFFIVALLCGASYNVLSLAGWLNLDPGLNAIVRAIALAVEALAAFVMSYRFASGGLTPARLIFFWTGLILLIVSTLPGLLLINAMSICGIAVLGYTVGARQIPWRFGLAALFVISILHAGKGTMRELYWKEEQDPIISPADYLQFIGQWIKLGAINSWGPATESEEHQSLMERASLMQLLLYVQMMTPNEVPFMHGETYSIIPRLLIPRFLDPEKIASHEGTYRLNIHYGFQTREDTARTTIGFGLLNEAYANFGFFGVAGLAVVTGTFYAAVAKWALGTPVLSFRSLFAAIVASYSFQSEFASGVYISALFQSTVALCGLALLFMRTRRISPDEGSLLE